ncbi:hypothetical protein TNCV_4826991 [Trichonephila clavipes]|nr:hypothetical protein TNCV_4826991 [Trichonephila clavipes]
MIAVMNESESFSGEGKIVEIDESKLEKRSMEEAILKTVNECLERLKENRINFFRVVASRTKDEILNVIKRRVVPGSIIILNCWKAYHCLSNKGYQHLQVNYSHF